MTHETDKPQCMIIPHWRMEGGAGFYIRDLLESLNPLFELKVAGRYGADYSADPIASVFFDKLGALSFPAYEGISARATIFHLARSIISIVGMILKPFKHDRKPAPSTLVFTSSVQALCIPVARHFFPKSKITIIVQEQVNLSKGFGRLVAWLLRRSDLVIAITKSWASHAQNFGINATVIRNTYDPSYADAEHNSAPPIYSDLLYVGGSAAIKGFEQFSAALPQLLDHPMIKIVCLGTYNQDALAKLKEIKMNAKFGSQLVVVGHVTDIRPYLRGTKLLLLPIGSPHFCRPAIEAGFFGKTFVIPDFPELLEFAKNEENCLTYAVENLDSFVTKTREIFEDCHRRAILEEGNRDLAQAFTIKKDLSMIFSANAPDA